MSDNQYVFEIIRDIGYLIQGIEENDTLWLNIKNDGKGFFTARSSGMMACGFSETSKAIEKAYKVTRNAPDKRDKEISDLKETMRQILCTEENYDDEQTVLNQIYIKCRKHLDT